MRRMRENSTWSRLSAEQRQRLEGWLFEENLGYTKILARVKIEFGIEATKTSLCRYCQRRTLERKAQGLVEAQFAADTLNGMATDSNGLRTAAVKLVGTTALKVAIEKPEEIEQLTSLTEVLLEAEQNDLRRGRLQFAQRRFDYEATVKAVKEIPPVRAHMQAVQDDAGLSNEEKIKEIQAMPFDSATEVKSGEVK